MRRKTTMGMASQKGKRGRHRLYQDGQTIAGMKVVGHSGGRYYIVECVVCGLAVKRTSVQIKNGCPACLATGAFTRRYSGLHYINPSEKIEAIKEKYKNGVTLEMIEDMVLNA